MKQPRLPVYKAICRGYWCQRSPTSWCLPRPKVLLPGQRNNFWTKGRPGDPLPSRNGRGGGGTLGNPKDSGWEDWGILGYIREEQGNHHPPPLRILLVWNSFKHSVDQSPTHKKNVSQKKTSESFGLQPPFEPWDKMMSFKASSFGVFKSHHSTTPHQLPRGTCQVDNGKTPENYLPCDSQSRKLHVVITHGWVYIGWCPDVPGHTNHPPPLRFNPGSELHMTWTIKFSHPKSPGWGEGSVRGIYTSVTTSPQGFGSSTTQVATGVSGVSTTNSSTGPLFSQSTKNSTSSSWNPIPCMEEKNGTAVRFH